MTTDTRQINFKITAEWKKNQSKGTYSDSIVCKSKLE